MKSSVNKFTKGMVQDLNEINQPNETYDDSMNGSLIYNADGNYDSRCWEPMSEVVASKESNIQNKSCDTCFYDTDEQDCSIVCDRLYSGWIPKFQEMLSEELLDGIRKLFPEKV